MENIIHHLDGYLSSLSRLSGQNRCAYWARLLDERSSYEECVRDYLENLDAPSYSISNISYQEVEALLAEYVLTKLCTDAVQAKELFVWDIVEYYGLASTAENKANIWNPLISNGAALITVESQHYQNDKRYIVEIDGKAVVTGLAIHRYCRTTED